MANEEDEKKEETDSGMPGPGRRNWARRDSCWLRAIAGLRS